MNSKEAHIIFFPSIGSSSIGYITVAEVGNGIPFDIKRVYWTYYTPHDVKRGGHAHKNLHQVIFAVNGKLEFNLEDAQGQKNTFILDEPQKGLYIPPNTWRDIKFSHNAVLCCIASEEFSEDDYIRSHTEFVKLNRL